MGEHTTRILQGNSVMARPKVIKLTVAALKVAKRGEAPLDIIPTRQSGVEVEYLVNNAGFDVFGYAIERDRAE
jgi:hypothetical protein